METFMDIAAIPAIATIAFLVAECVKQIPSVDKAWIPAICGVVGAILGVVALYTSPQLMPATDIISAIAIGIVSGLAATGTHQIFKQLSNDGEKH